LALYDVERYALVGELDGVGVAKLLGCEPPPQRRNSAADAPASLSHAAADRSPSRTAESSAARACKSRDWPSPSAWQASGCDPASASRAVLLVLA
jgi:hypothetical protein